MFKFYGLFVLLTFVAVAQGAGGGVGGGESKQASQDGSDTENTKTVRQDKPLTLKCMLDTVDVTWSVNGTEIKKLDVDDSLSEDERITFDTVRDEEKDQEFAQMTITKADSDVDLGNYTCQSNVNQKAFTISVIVLSFKKMDKSRTVFQADPFNLTCEVEGIPPPTIQWFKDFDYGKDAVNIPIKSTNISDAKKNQSIFTLYHGKNGVPNAVLGINAAVDSHRGEYMCLINSYGLEANTTTFIRVKDMYAALWPFLGICAEVVVLCLIIFIYEKKRMKNDLDESDTDQPNDHKRKFKKGL